MALKSVNPANKTQISIYEELSDQELDAQVALAQTAFESWREVSLGDRAGKIAAAATYLREHKSRFAKVITDEVGKTLAASEAEIEKCATVCDYYADNVEEILKHEVIKTDASESFVRFDPLGIVLAVMPWNFPFWQVFRFAAPALIAGNVGLLKHASNVQGSAQAIQEVFEHSGFPSGAFINLAVGSSKVESILRDARVKAVTLTGSEYAGSAVAKTAGEEIKKTLLELGGSDPFIVLKDTDVSAAAESAVLARMQANAGQSCIAAKRFIIHQSIVEEFTRQVVAIVEKLQVGDPTDPSTDVGPLASEQMLREVSQQVQDSVEKGAKILAGGQPGSADGYYYLPTVLTNVSAGMPVYDEEVFGPVIPIIPFDSNDQAISIANASPYGLGATIFTADIESAKELAARIESGMVFINNQVKSSPHLPFGGIKKSGYGREVSSYGIKEFVNIKAVWIK